MRFAFITPSFHSLGPAWRRDPQIVKLGTPQIAGALFGNGYEDIRQYDFEVEIFDLERTNPGLLNLRAFFDGDLRWLRHYGFASLDVPTLSGGVGA